MKILHLAPIKVSKKDNSNFKEINNPEGISKSVPHLAAAQIRLGYRVGIITSAKSETLNDDQIYWGKLENLILSISLFYKIIKKFGKPDVLHIHDIFSLKQIYFSLFFIFYGVNIFISPRGCFSEIALSRSKFKKKLFLIFYKQYSKLIHSFVALNEGEKKQITKIFGKKNIIIISNGSDINLERDKNLKNVFKKKNENSLFTLGYLGRFDVYIKGLDNLLNAFDNYQQNSTEPNINLVFIGEHRSKEFNSINFFERKKNKLLKPDMFQIKKALYGIEKWKALASFDLLVLPSRSEGMPNVVLEAMSIGTPCVVSPQTNMGEIIKNSNSGWIINSNANDIENFLHKLSKINKDELINKGMNAKNYIKQHLTWDKIARGNYFVE